MDKDYENVRSFVLRERRTGVAYLHQHLLLGKNKIERILSKLEKDGVVSKIGKGGTREVLLDAPPIPKHYSIENNHDLENGEDTNEIERGKACKIVHS